MRVRIDVELGEPLPQRSAAEHRVAERDAEVAQHGRVGEVALPARHRQLLGEVAQQRVGEAEVAFGVLEVDRVDLVRHRRRADLAGHASAAGNSRARCSPRRRGRGRSGSVLTRASASQYSAMQSCGSICVVYGLNSSPSAFDDRRARSAPSRLPDRRRRARCSCRPRRSSCP